MDDVSPIGQERFILTVTGKDHPGIVAGIANILCEYGCNIQELNQTVLGDEFAMILLVQPTREIDFQDLDNSLRECCKWLNVNHTLRIAEATSEGERCVAKDRVIITVLGSDKIGIIAGVASVLASMNINIVELSAAPYKLRDELLYAVVARVEADDMSMPALKTALEDCAKKLSVEIEVQSQNVFDVMHKI